jgi:hypothetical protein
LNDSSFTRGGHRLVLRGNRGKLGLHPLPTHIVGARRKDGSVVRSRVRIDLRRQLVHGVVVNRAAPAELDGITGRSIRLLDAVAEESGAVGRLVARHLLRGKNYGFRRAFRDLVRVRRFLRELDSGMNPSSGIVVLNASSGIIPFNTYHSTSPSTKMPPTVPASMYPIASPDISTGRSR